MQVELWTYEKAVRQSYLETGSEMQLEMSSTADGRSLFGANGRSDTGILGDDKTRARATESALQLDDSALCDERLINTIDIDKCLPGLERPIIFMHRLKVNFRSSAQTLAEHNVAAEPEKEAVEARRSHHD